MEEEKIPSPYLNTLSQPSEEDQKFVEKIKEVCSDFGYKDFFIAFTPKVITHKTARKWKGFSNALSEDMVVYLEIISQTMRTTWEKVKGKK